MAAPWVLTAFAFLVFGFICVTAQQVTIKNLRSQLVLDSNYHAYTQYNPSYPRPFVFQAVGSDWQTWTLRYQGETTYLIQSKELKCLVMDYNAAIYNPPGSTTYPMPYLGECNTKNALWNFTKISANTYTIKSYVLWNGYAMVLDGYVDGVSQFNTGFRSPFVFYEAAQENHQWVLSAPLAPFENNCFMRALIFPGEIVTLTLKPRERTYIKVSGFMLNYRQWNAGYFFRAFKEETLESGYVTLQVKSFASEQNDGTVCDAVNQGWWVDSSYFSLSTYYEKFRHWKWAGSEQNNVFIVLTNNVDDVVELKVNTILKKEYNVVTQPLLPGDSVVAPAVFVAPSAHYIAKLETNGALWISEKSNPVTPVLWTSGSSNEDTYTLQVTKFGVKVCSPSICTFSFEHPVMRSISFALRDTGNLVLVAKIFGEGSQPIDWWTSSGGSGAGLPILPGRSFYPGDYITHGSYTIKFECTGPTTCKLSFNKGSTMLWWKNYNTFFNLDYLYNAKGLGKSELFFLNYESLAQPSYAIGPTCAGDGCSFGIYDGNCVGFSDGTNIFPYHCDESTSCKNFGCLV